VQLSVVDLEAKDTTWVLLVLEELTSLQTPTYSSHLSTHVTMEHS